jgi:ribulose 1,5-bisphosphate synthetase/thiazole synthase
MEKYKLVREIPVEDNYDLVVAGGGPAGTAAAICAARLGAKVLLIEATGCLGGMGTSGLVNCFDPMANGETMLVGGFMRELVEKMYVRGYLQPGIDPNSWRKNYHVWTPFKLEGLKIMLDEYTVAAGVEVRLFTRVIDADADSKTGCVRGVVIQNVEGYSYIRAKTFIDATGDAILADLCGAEYREAGRDTPNIMPATLDALYADVDWKNFNQFDRYERVPMIEKAYEEGIFTQLDRHLPGMCRIGETTGCMNAGHVYNLNALRCKDLTQGMMFGRKIAQEYAEFYRKNIPGCENAEIVTTATLMGVRESRRIVGEYELNFDDYMERREFPDQIGVYNKFVDIHCYDNSLEEWERLKRTAFGTETGAGTDRLGEGEYFGIPYSILVPKGWENLWVAGRCNSSDRKVHGSIRVMPSSAMMGQAAGTAAVQSIKTGQPACELNTEQLVTTLRENDAYLPQKTLSRKMTRV